MTLDRRAFIGAVGAASVAAASRVWAASIRRVGVQLYTVRGEMEKNFEATLARVARLGFKEVEFAGYFGRSPSQVRATLSRNGLKSPSAHVDYASLTGDAWSKAIDNAKTIGHDYLIVAWLDDAFRKQPD